MSSVGFSDVRNLGSSQKLYLFRVSIDSIPSGVTGSGLEDTINLRCNSTIMPGRDIEPVMISLGGFHREEPGMGRFNMQWPCTFIEGMTTPIAQMCQSWSALAYDPDTGVGADFGSMTTTVTLTQLDNNKNAIRQIRLEDVWLMSFPDTPMDYNTSDAVRIDAIFNYSRWLPVANPTS